MTTDTTVREIPLSQGLVALVDADDYDRVIRGWKWYAYHHGRTFYGTRRAQRPDGSITTQRLHRVILGLVDPAVSVDHRNGDGLDNRKQNLRVATKAQNNQNTRVRLDNRSGYRGVTWHKHTGRWRAQICVDGRRTHLGLFDTAEQAALVYDTAARQHHGAFASLNFPVRDERPARRTR